MKKIKTECSIKHNSRFSFEFELPDEKAIEFYRWYLREIAKLIEDKVKELE